MRAGEMSLGLAITEKNDCGEATHLVVRGEFYILSFVHFEPGKFNGTLE